MQESESLHPYHKGAAATRSWAEYCAKFLTFVSIALCVLGIILYSVDLYRHGKQKHYIGWFSSAGFVLLTIAISVRLIVLHLTHWNLPHIQKYVVRIIWMVPIYAAESWFSLRFKFMALYFEKLRESYESYVIFCFLYYLIGLLGDEQALILRLKSHSADQLGQSERWLCSSSNYVDAAELVQRCKFGVFQYVLIKNISALLICILAFAGIYEEGDFRFNHFFVYQCVINNASQLWALHCLVQFYYNTKDGLAAWRPVGKFLCVKTVVFFTWWQSIMVELLINSPYGVEFSESKWTVNEVSKGLQDYLICIEMFFASIAFTYAFTHKDYSVAKVKREDDDVDSSDSDELRPFLSAFLQSSVPDDFVADVKKWARAVIPGRDDDDVELATLRQRTHSAMQDELSGHTEPVPRTP